MQSQKRQNDLCSFPRQTILFRSCISLHPHKQYKRICFSPCPLIIYVCKFFDDGYSEWCGVISHCSFDLHVSYSNDVEHFFKCSLAICKSLLSLLAILWNSAFRCLYLSFSSLPSAFQHYWSEHRLGLL